MRQIGKLPDESAARRFADFLLTQEISSTVDAGNEGWIVWGHDEDKIEQARAEFERFQQSPDDSRYRESADVAQKIREQERQANKQAQKRQVDVRRQWNRPTSYQIPITMALIAISVMVAVMTKLGSDNGPLMNLLYFAPIEDTGNGYVTFAKPSLSALWAIMMTGEVWRLVTPVFLHFTFMHILFNMWMLRDLGTAIEIRRNSWRFLGLVLFTAIVSNFAQYTFKGPLFGGMSGVVYGLFGYIWMKSRFDPQAGFFMAQSTVFILIGWLFLCMTGAMGPVANAAHVAGMISGMVCGYARPFLRGLGLVR